MYFLPFIAGFVGYLTNYMAIKMLFHPRLPINFLGYKLQGVLPKRQQEVAKSIGDIVAKDLLSVTSIAQGIDKEKTKDAILQFLGPKIDVFLKEKITEKFPMFAMFLTQGLLTQIRDSILEQVSSVSHSDIEELSNHLLKDLDIQKMVQEKVASFSVEKLEEVLKAILKKEFRHIEWIGAVIGFLIGLVQLALVKFS